ncbi:MAG TPA: TIGR04500 family putative peptide maturation system protein [Kofleriaceae bacterium]|nr:TIGR04500 family putative peptide maturation system protein [Kofleriaceae bacterium]
MTPDLLTDGLDFLLALARDRAAPDLALARLAALQARHPDVPHDLVWEDEPLADGPGYDLMLAHPAHGTIALSVAPPDQLPIPLRGLTRWRDSDIVRVDGRRLGFDDVLILLDSIWSDRQLLDRIVDLALLRREMEREPVEVGDAELQQAVDAFRVARGLATAEATERWLASRSMTLVDLEQMVLAERNAIHLRRRLVGDAARARVAASPERYDRVALAAFPVDSPDAARAVVAEVARGGDFLAIAERVLGARHGEPRGHRSLVFERFARCDVAPLEDAALADGAVVAARLRGAGPYVARIAGVGPADPEAAQEAAEEELFAAWLAERRAAAHVEWHWGRADA